MMLRRKLEEQAELQRAIELQGRLLINFLLVFAFGRKEYQKQLSKRTDAKWKIVQEINTWQS
jgi:hypothetical protein